MIKLCTYIQKQGLEDGIICMSDFWIQEDETLHESQYRKPYRYFIDILQDLKSCDYASYIKNRDLSGSHIR